MENRIVKHDVVTSEDLLKWVYLIGTQVVKRSNKPFKSSKKVNTVRGIVKNPQTNRFAFIFEEDDSNVECWKCKTV